MKTLKTLLVLLIITACSSSDDNNNQGTNEAFTDYQHWVVLTDSNSNQDVTITYTHNSDTGTFSINSGHMSEIREFDNSFNTTYVLTNPAANDSEVIQFESYRKNDITGTYLEPNGSNVPEEDISFWTIGSGETAIIYYDYSQQKFIKQ